MEHLIFTVKIMYVLLLEDQATSLKNFFVRGGGSAAGEKWIYRAAVRLPEASYKSSLRSQRW